MSYPPILEVSILLVDIFFGLNLPSTKSKKSYKEFLFKKNDTVLFGRESSGVPTSVHKKVSHRLTIPMMNKKRSLNLSSSVSIVVSKILNQTNF